MTVSRPIFLYIIAVTLSATQPLFAQLGFDLDIKKPEPYENRELRAEKSDEKKWTRPRKLLQGMVTHYNYFFNAHTKLNEIIDRAKASHKDDYAQLLPFYNYSLNHTAGDSLQLDSVIYKAKTGIVLHDLRNEWIDDLYLLWGASYYLKQQYDSAYQMFQFINYAFAPKEKDGYYRYIGSRIDGSKDLTISTPEEEGFLKRMVSDPPSRNNALLWQIRTLIQQQAFAEAGSMIATLKEDPTFPPRLNGELEEVQAYWFYRQELWDSSALHLVNALDAAGNKQEIARWEYLAGQMFDRTGAFEKARTYYLRAIAHTTDPVLDVYARLNLIRNNKEGGNDYIDRIVSDLVKMAKRDRYADYRDVIYSMAAQIELERNNFIMAHAYLTKASKYKTDNTLTSNRAYLKLADLSFDQKAYLQAASFYDSVQTNELTPAEVQRIDQRKQVLQNLVTSMLVVSRQDSLLRIAALPEAEREAMVRRVVRQMRRQQGLKDEEVSAGGRTQNAPATDLFAAQQAKGEWYFNNDFLKASGVTVFKQTWGTRPNVDNWRRFTDVTAQLRNTIPNNNRGTLTDPDPNAPPTYEVVLARLPVTAEQVAASNDSIQRALFAMGRIYVNDLEDYSSAVDVFEKIRMRFPEYQQPEQVLFQLYYSYYKTGDSTKAAVIRNELLQKFPGSRYATMVQPGSTDTRNTKPLAAVTNTYEEIYDLFVEGRFEEALQAKKVADSIHNTSYWSPQLLYIEAVYHIQQRQDSVAQLLLSTLAQQQAGTDMGNKAENMMQVLSRRKEIESELSKLQVTRPGEDTIYVEPMPVVTAVEKKENIVLKPKDTVTAKPVNTQTVTNSSFKTPEPVKTNNIYSFSPNLPHYAVVVLNKVDGVYANEARNAFNKYNRERFSSQPMQVTAAPISPDIRLLVIGPFTNAQGAIDYVQTVKPLSASQIMPWLKADKFTFSIISDQNLQTVSQAKDFSAYKLFLDQNLPVKF